MKHLIFILTLFTLTSCNDNFEDSTSERQLVVEGWLTDIDTFQVVKLSYTQPLLGSNTTNYPDDASITISGNNGDALELVYSGRGVYRSPTKYNGLSGVYYTLRIELSNEEIITSTAELMHIAPMIDTLTYDFYERQSETNANIIERVYYPIPQIEDEADQNNYYRWKIYRNDTLFNTSEDIILMTDRFFDGNTPKFENEFTSFEFFENDSISLQLHEIPKSGYDFLRVLKTQTSSSGTSITATPSPIRGNLFYLNSNKTVLGYWGTASIQTSGIKIIQ